MKMRILALAMLIFVLGTADLSAQRYYERPPTGPFTGTNRAFNRIFYGSGLVPGAPGVRGGIGTTGTTAVYGTRSWTSSSTDDPVLPEGNVTGHPTRFFHYQHYFFNQGGGGGSTTPAPLVGSGQGQLPLPFGVTATRAGQGEVGKRPNISKKN